MKLELLLHILWPGPMKIQKIADIGIRHAGILEISAGLKQRERETPHGIKVVIRDNYLWRTLFKVVMMLSANVVRLKEVNSRGR